MQLPVAPEVVKKVLAESVNGLQLAAIQVGRSLREAAIGRGHGNFAASEQRGLELSKAV